MVKDNQDYYKRGGRSGGPAGPRSQQKQKLTKERAVLQRDEERKLPGERPLSGKKPQTQAFTAVEDAEAQLASLHAEEKRRGSVLDRLPKPPGAAGVPRSAKPIPSPTSGVSLESEGIEAGETGTWNMEPREEEAPFNYGIPASEDAALGHKREPFERENREMAKTARAIDRAAHQREITRELSPMARRAVERFPQIFRMVGDAARAVDRPVRRALETLQWLGSAATRKAT